MDTFALTTGTTTLLAIVVFFASVLSAMTGMAGGILMFLTMNLAIPLRPLVAVHGTVQVFNNAALSLFLRHGLRLNMCAWFTVGAVAGAAMTTIALSHLVPEALTLSMLTVMTLYALLRPDCLPPLILSDRNHIWLGLATGSVGILAGAVDPLLGAFFLRDDLSKEEIVANKSFMQFVTHLTKIPAYMYLGFAFHDHLGLIAVFSIAALLGARTGVYLLNRINPSLFFMLMKTAMWAVCLRVSYQLFAALTQS